MDTRGRLSDHAHPRVRTTTDQLTRDEVPRLEKLESLFRFVRDGIPFGFPPKWDAVKASETLQYEVGYCNTKATLFLALCRAVDIPARVHTGLIDLEIMRGVFPSFAFPFLPGVGSHSWTEVEVEGEWKPIDSYINDRRYYEGALPRLQESGIGIGFSICRRKGPSSCDFNFGEKGFLHMGAVVEDHGAWNDFSEYMASEKYSSMPRAADGVPDACDDE